MAFHQFTTRGAPVSRLFFLVCVTTYALWTMGLLLSLAYAQKAGSWYWWLFLLVLNTFVLILFYRLAVFKIEVTNLIKGKFSIEFKGPLTKMTLHEVHEFAFWYRLKKRPVKKGGNAFVERFVMIRTGNGTEITFRQKGGDALTVPKHWPYKEYKPGWGRNIVHVANLEEMVSFLVNFR